MAEPTIALPPSKSTGNDERSVLFGYLTYHRAVLARKIDGVTDEQARTPQIPTSGMTLLGLIRHMTDVERWWFRQFFRGEDIPSLFPEEAEWDVPADATVADALEAYWAEIAVVDADLASAHPDDENVPRENAPQNSLRRLITHMIEEYARHCGHADLMREAIDGVIGD